MSTVSVGRLLNVWSFRLKMNNEGLTKWTPSMRTSVEDLVNRLSLLNPDASITIDADENRNPIAIFILAQTGEVLGEINQPPDRT
jgi:hypothetical protein